MSSRLAACCVFVACLAPVAARADIVTGSFTGTLGDGTDTTGVFGPPGGDLTNEPITGTFVYNTTLFSQSVSGGANTATGTGLGALTVNITIGTGSYTFTDPTASGVFLDDGSVSGQSEFTISNSNNHGSLTNESFYLDISDAFTPFVFGTDLSQSISTSDPLLSSIGSFSIHDTVPNVAAAGDFSITSLSDSVSSSVPEPASALLLLTGIAGIAVRGRGSECRVGCSSQPTNATCRQPLAGG